MVKAKCVGQHKEHPGSWIIKYLVKKILLFNVNQSQQLIQRISSLVATLLWSWELPFPSCCLLVISEQSVQYIYQFCFCFSIIKSSTHGSSTRYLWVAELRHINKLTLREVVSGRETDGLQFTVCNKLDVQVSPAGTDVCRAFLPAVATNEGREAKRSIPNLNVVELALPGRFYGVLVIEEQVNALAWSSWRRGTGQRGAEKQQRRWRRFSQKRLITFYDVDTLPLSWIFLRVIGWGEIPSFRLLYPGPTLSSRCHTWVVSHWKIAGGCKWLSVKPFIFKIWL